MTTLESIRKRAEKASPGPWERDTNLPFSLEFMGIFAPGSERYIIRADDDREDPTTRADAEFIAHAREDIPALLNVIDAALKALAPYYRSSECRADVEHAFRILTGDDPIPTSADVAEVKP